MQLCNYTAVTHDRLLVLSWLTGAGPCYTCLDSSWTALPRWSVDSGTVLQLTGAVHTIETVLELTV